MSTMLVAQALDERDLLVKKIKRKISEAKFISVGTNNSKTVVDGENNKEDFEKAAVSAFDQIEGLIKRYGQIDTAIIASNAETKVNIEGLGEISVAAAISLRNRITSCGKYGGEANFEKFLIETMNSQINSASYTLSTFNRKIEQAADRMREGLSGKDSDSQTSTETLDVVDAWKKTNEAFLIDPLNCVEKVSGMRDYVEKLKTDLDIQIKVSNARTEIEIPD